MLELAGSHSLLVTIEENAVQGGAGSAVTELLHAGGITLPVVQLGLPDAYIDHGDQTQMLADCGLSADGIAAAIAERLQGGK